VVIKETEILEARAIVCVCKFSGHCFGLLATWLHFDDVCEEVELHCERLLYGAEQIHLLNY